MIAETTGYKRKWNEKQQQQHSFSMHKKSDRNWNGFIEVQISVYHITARLGRLRHHLAKKRMCACKLYYFSSHDQDLVDIPAAAYLTPASTRTRANHTKKLRQISSRSDAYKFSFFPHTIPVWNSLPATVAEAPDLASFKQGLFTLTF